MATAMKECRVCGKLYEACRTAKHVAGVFRWQDVACSPECGSIYLARIEESRRVNKAEIKDAGKITETVKNDRFIDLVEDEDEIDEDEFYAELDEYFDDAE